ncbi:MAG: hypothetical protein CMH27_04120 [Micavibrio sp.]|nr:hypothetical protein [Micavibrio sp.]|tara:strand:- start:5166 stop:6860 length:1695 start_codon:yes stop_codon:yes gene_type:complete
MLFKIWKHCRELRLKLSLLLFITVLDAFLATFSISLVLPITSAALGSGGESDVWFNQYIPGGMADNIKLLLFFMAIILCIKFFVTLLRVLLSIYYTEDLRLQWQKDLSKNYILQPLKAINANRQGMVVNDLIYETGNGASFIFNYLSYLSLIIITASVLILLLTINWFWMGLALIVCALGWFTVGRTYFKYARRLGKKAIALNQDLNAIMIESIQGIKDIKISNSETFHTGKIEEIAEATNYNRKLVKIAQDFPVFAKDLIFAVTVVVIALYMPTDLEQVKTVMPQIALFIVAFTKLASSISQISSFRFKVTSKYPSFKLVIKLLNTQKAPPENLETGKKVASFGDYIRLKDVHFGYDEDKPVLDGVDIEIRKGQIVCITGPSGSGKTTIMDVLTRLYDIDSGNIEVPQGDAGQFSLGSWRQLIGYVPQDPIIYYGTIRENITLGHPDISDDDVHEACRLAGITDLLDSLPEGINAMLYEKGENLSGGQKKRLALARVIAHKCQLIILDETTNAIQEQAEREILANLKQNEDLTIIIITHRESTMKLADVNYRIEAGRAVQIDL